MSGAAPGAGPGTGRADGKGGALDRLVGRLLRAGVSLQSPILVREMRTLLRGRKFFVSHILLLVVLAGVLLIAATTSAVTGDDSSSVGRLLFFAFFGGLGVVVVFLVPAFSCTAVTTEREGRTLDLLLTTTIRPWEIVWGKTLSALVVILLFMASALPLVTVSFLFGGISPWDLIMMYMAVLFVTLIVSSLSLAVSSHCRESKSAVVIAYVLTLVVCGLLIPVASLLMDILNVRELTSISAAMSMRHWTEQALILLVPLFLSLALFALNFAAAANRLKPPTANRSTNLRAIWFGFLLGCLFLLMVVTDVGVKRGWLGLAEWYFTLALGLGVLSPLLWLSTIYFASEETRLPPRLLEDCERLGGLRLPLRAFMPGPASGLAYAAVCTLLIMGGMVWFCGASASSLDRSRLLHAGASFMAPVGLFLLTSAGIAAFFSSLGLKHRPAGFAAFGVSTLLAFGPLIHMGCQQLTNTGASFHTLLNFHYLCPVLAGMSAWSSGAGDMSVTLFAPDADVMPAAGSGMPLWQASAIAYGILTLLVWTLAMVRIRRAQARWRENLARIAAEQGGTGLEVGREQIAGAPRGTRP